MPPLHISIFDNFIYVTDCGNACISIFDLDGNYITKYGEEGDFIGLHGITISENGTLFVSEVGSNQIQRLSEPFRML